MNVDRCVCCNTTFADLKRLHDQRAFGLEEIKRATGCGTHCTLCVPYIVLMLETGRTRFDYREVASITKPSNPNPANPPV